MLRLKQIAISFYWYKRVISAIPKVIGQWKAKNPGTKKTLKKLKRPTSTLPFIVIVGVDIETSPDMFWVGLLRKIFIQIKEVNKVNFLTI